MTEPIFKLTFLRFYLLYGHIFVFENYVKSVLIEEYEATNVNIEPASEILQQFQ